MSTEVANTACQLTARLSKFMGRPQRHRLLHGYPLAAAMPYSDSQVRHRAANGDPAFVLPHNSKATLLVGVLPHPFCNPKISGCGFCTFPHETFSNAKSTTVVAAVTQEIDQRLAQQPEFRNASVTVRKLADAFNVSEAEVSLEGVPRNFDPDNLRPGVPLLLDVMREMQADVQQAIDIGLDQICLYHLVVFRGLGTVWSRDAALLSTLPANEEAADNWLVLREYLIDRGFRQTSLTNFERAELATDPRRYRYEQISYESDRCQVLGFGPAGISYSSSDDGKYALKTMNPESSAEYLQAVRSLGSTWNRHFQYTPHDLQLLHLTRWLAALRIDKGTFSQIHGPSAWDRDAERFDLLVAEGLLRESQQDYALTPRGMFFSDSCAALLADSRRQTLGNMPLVAAAANNNGSGFM